MEDEFIAEEWFTLLEPAVRNSAIAHNRALSPDSANYTYSSLANAINGSFIWEYTPEGHKFW